MLIFLISLAAGALTILAPCVLPLLPVIIGGSLGGDARQKGRPYIIAGSLAGSLIIFTLLLKLSTVLINLSPNFLLYTSGGLVIALGLVSVFPGIWEQLLGVTGLQAKAQVLLGQSDHNRGKYIGPILVGAALGPVFSSCSPTYAFILASVLPRDFASGLIYLCAYSLGLVITLLAVVLAGRKYISRYSWAVDSRSIFRRSIGVLFVLVGLAIISGANVNIETWIGNHTPFDEAKLEQSLLAERPGARKTKPVNNNSAAVSFDISPVPAPNFVGLTNWINSPPLTMSGLRGKVVLVDFWTYSCVNCLRTLPFVEKLYQTYEPDGLVVVGVSTPEFAFEHIPANVEAAVQAHGLTYPIALDNNYDTWDAFDNDSWPAEYLIDKSGNLRNINLGEGDYNHTERLVQDLLGISGPLKAGSPAVPFEPGETSETYFGTNRDTNFTGSPKLQDGTNNYTPTASLSTDQWTLGGGWNVSGEYITSTSNSSTLTFSVKAKDVYMVAGSQNNQPEPVKVSLPNNSQDYGSDVSSGIATVAGSRLYHIVSLGSFGQTTVSLTVPAGVSLYTFTFGG
jgi:cytochrome c biogenesis protein CcdA/thiol-disulfide isomerase/thioredoxin